MTSRSSLFDRDVRIVDTLVAYASYSFAAWQFRLVYARPNRHRWLVVRLIVQSVCFICPASSAPPYQSLAYNPVFPRTPECRTSAGSQNPQLSHRRPSSPPTGVSCRRGSVSLPRPSLHLIVSYGALVGLCTSLRRWPLCKPTCRAPPGTQ